MINGIIVQNNPVNFVDSEGKIAVPVVVAGAALLAAGTTVIALHAAWELGKYLKNKFAEPCEIPQDQIGPSGKPKVHVKKHPSLKKAKDAARARAGKGGTTVKHPTPRKGKGHFHGKKQDGTKIRIHDEFP